jgi:hypothetical protein
MKPKQNLSGLVNNQISWKNHGITSEKELDV